MKDNRETFYLSFDIDWSTERDDGRGVHTSHVFPRPYTTVSNIIEDIGTINAYINSGKDIFNLVRKFNIPMPSFSWCSDDEITIKFITPNVVLGGANPAHLCAKLNETFTKLTLVCKMYEIYVDLGLESVTTNFDDFANEPTGIICNMKEFKHLTMDIAKALVEDGEICATAIFAISSLLASPSLLSTIAYFTDQGFRFGENCYIDIPTSYNNTEKMDAISVGIINYLTTADTHQHL